MSDKLNNLLNNWPPNTIKTAKNLNKSGYNKQLLLKYKHSNWIKSVGIGAYHKTSDQVNWQGAVYALQNELNLSIHPAGKTALELNGLAHYVPVYQTNILLFGKHNEKLPRWFKHFIEKYKMHYVRTNLFKNKTENELSDTDNEPKIKISAPERAFIEYCYLVPKKYSFDEADKIAEMLIMLRPKVVQNLLESCTSVKTKRLFLYFANKHDHDWLKEINLNKINLGSGKRQILKGHYDNKYKITVPKEDDRQF